ncbi:MAG: M24 family metallopeptidase [Haloarculaceae archaeon]
MDSVGDGDERCERLDALLDDRGLAAVWVARPNNFAWLTGGDNVVDRDGGVGVAAAGYDGETVTVITDDVEGPRLREEELPDDVAVETFAWHETSLSAAVANASPRPAAADVDVPGFESLACSTIRQPLTDAQCERYRRLGTETAAVVESVCRDCTASDTERETAATLRARLTERGIDSPVALVGGSDRARKYRHYTPSDAELGRYALVSVTARRDGLYASCTRTVAFDAPDWLADRHAAAARVEASALSATRRVGRDGGTAGDVFGAIRRAYDAVGWDGEWRNHHQGGAAGYAGREWIATPSSDAPVRLPMGYAWNPTVEGTKSEDTVLVTANDFEVLTATGEWPTTRVEAVDSGATFDRPAVLER